MKFFAAKNLTTSAIELCVPWDFKSTENITAQIRNSKSDRQNFYQNPKTNHCFYTGLEGVNPALRVGRENPPRAIHAFIADYDVPISDERIAEVVKDAKHKPTYVETSLGGNRRLIWLCPAPLLTESYEFATFILQQAEKWLNLQALPDLDQAAFVSASRLYCVGDKWQSTGHISLDPVALQAFFVQCGREFRFKSSDEVRIGLDVVEAALKKQYDSFNWPGDFSEGSQGPSFWITGSLSPLSAIIKPDGMFTFSAHAAKPFYSWQDILGKEFVKRFAEETMAKATSEIYYDGRKYHRKNPTNYVSMERGEFTTFLRVSCNLSAKPDGSETSAVDKALDHLHSHQRVVGAAPFVFRRPGLIHYQEKPTLNIYDCKPMEPAGGIQTWGPSGSFPFLSKFYDTYFNPPTQLIRFLAWWKYYYEAAYNWKPMPGQNSVFMGEAGIGKTFSNRHHIGRSVGGFSDAATFLVEGSSFNSNLLMVPHWALDDDTPNSGGSTASKTHQLFKKLAANQDFEFHKKFEIPCMVEWTGRLGITANLDFQSTRIVGPLDEGNIGKLNIFKCARAIERDGFAFPSRTETSRLTDTELPYFLRWLLDWVVPDEVPRDTRYGFAAYQEPSLLDQTHQSNPAAPFKELLLDSLAEWFRGNPGETTWSGSVSRVIQMIMADPRNEQILRTLRLEQTNRYLEQIQREGVVKCEAAIDATNKTRVWTFHKAVL